MCAPGNLSSKEMGLITIRITSPLKEKKSYNTNNITSGCSGEMWVMLTHTNAHVEINYC